MRVLSLREEYAKLSFPPGDAMASSAQRHVIFAEDEPSIRRLLHALLAGEPLVGRTSRGEEDVYTIITRDKFDAILVDLQSVAPPRHERPSPIMNVSPILVGRVLVITADATDPEARQNIIRHCLPDSMPNHRLRSFWHRLRTVLDPSR